MIDRDPYFSSEAQEVFADGCRVFAIEATICAGEGSEGTYVGRTKHGPMILWDTPDGNGYAETVQWDRIRNLYR